jgi:hypothetical protein
MIQNGVFENRVLRREEVVGGWRRLHNEELHNLTASPNIIRVIKSKKSCERHVARMENMKGRNNWETEE